MAQGWFGIPFFHQPSAATIVMRYQSRDTNDRQTRQSTRGARQDGWRGHCLPHVATQSITQPGPELPGKQGG